MTSLPFISAETDICWPIGRPRTSLGCGRAKRYLSSSSTRLGQMKAKGAHGGVWGNDNLLFERKFFPFFWTENGLPN
jgi:hypothetical protein